VDHWGAQCRYFHASRHLITFGCNNSTPSTLQQCSRRSMMRCVRLLSICVS
jgi:hypothetical protein